MSNHSEEKRLEMQGDFSLNALKKDLPRSRSRSIGKKNEIDVTTRSKTVD